MMGMGGEFEEVVGARLGGERDKPCLTEAGQSTTDCMLGTQCTSAVLHGTHCGGGVAAM